MTGILSEFLNTHSEIHSFVIGIYSGLTEWKGIDSEVMKNPDVKKEPHYCYGGYVLGTILRWMIIITLVQCGVSIV